MPREPADETGRNEVAGAPRMPKSSASPPPALLRILKDPSPKKGLLVVEVNPVSELRSGDLVPADESERSLEVQAATMFRTDVNGDRATLRRAAEGREKLP